MLEHWGTAEASQLASAVPQCCIILRGVMLEHWGTAEASRLASAVPQCYIITLLRMM
jgi:hypothetical protein